MSLKITLSKEFTGAKLKKPVLDAFGDLNLLLGREFQQRITAYIWAWPKETVRKKGKKAIGSPRDIVDQGGLRDSYTMDGRRGSTHYRHVWAMDYAAAVHNGAVINNGFGRGIRFTLTARPWTRVTMRELDLQTMWTSLVQQKVAQLQ